MPKETRAEKVVTLIRTILDFGLAGRAADSALGVAENEAPRIEVTSGVGSAVGELVTAGATVVLRVGFGLGLEVKVGLSPFAKATVGLAALGVGVRVGVWVGVGVGMVGERERVRTLESPEELLLLPEKRLSLTS